MMNVSLKLPPKKKKKTSKQKGPPKDKSSSARTKNVFGEDDDDDSDNGATAADSSSQRRDNVNRAIQKEQEAMRKRAEQTMKKQMEEQQGDTSIYDYDSFKAQQQNDTQQQQHAPNNNDTADPPKSRYIADLLKAAKERNLERDIAYERKMAREQEQEEEENVDLQGKEKFVTAGYKRKLEERRLWKEQRDREDAAAAEGEGTMANFYGNFSKNVALGGGGGAAQSKTAEEEVSRKTPVEKSNSNFLQGFEKNNTEANQEEGKPLAAAEPSATTRQTNATFSSTSSSKKQRDALEPEVARAERRKQREEKVARARERYLHRHGMQETNAAVS